MNLPSIEELKNSLIHSLDKYVYIDDDVSASEVKWKLADM